MQRKPNPITFIAQYLLNDTTIVEVTDDIVEVVKKTQTQSPNHGGRPGVHTVSHWRRFDIDTLTDDESEIYNFLLEEECGDDIPVKEFVHTVDDFQHRLYQYKNHWVYHAIIPARGVERVVVARNIDTLKNNRYGLKVLLKAFGF